MNVLGLSAYYHDSAACLVNNGRIVAAAQEERFTRKKHDARFPHYAIRCCLGRGGIGLGDIDRVVFYDKPFLKFERLLETYIAFAPKGFASFRMAMPVWLREKLFLKDLLKKELKKHGSADFHERLLFSEHHLSHAASAFFPSPFEESAVLTMDGVGEWATTSMAVGHGNRLDITKEIFFPHSLGLLYSAMTYYTGFKVNSGEHKVMGLAPYGEPKYAKLIMDTLIDIKEDGSFRLDMQYFDYCAGLRMTNDRFDALFGAPPRDPESMLTQRDMDLAASVQAVTDEVVLRLARALVKETGIENLCLAGGVALNCVSNGKVLRDGAVKNLWIQPAAGDAGGALGAALAGYYLYEGQARIVNGSDAMQGSYLGNEYSSATIAARLRDAGAVFEHLGEDQLIERCAFLLSQGQALGWFQGRMEFGPRSLGARSILGDPRSPVMQSTLNLKVKYRESFRPFAPSVLREDVSEWFDLNGDSPYMLLVADISAKRRILMNEDQDRLFGIEKLKIPRSDIPAVTHVDYSARVQTVHADTNPLFHQLIKRFKQLTGCPVLVNTSFNVRGEPIVENPSDAFRCFMGTGLDALAIGDFLLLKSQQIAKNTVAYHSQFDRD